MKHKLLAGITAMALLCGSMTLTPFAVTAEEQPYSAFRKDGTLWGFGPINEDLNYAISEDGVLTISGKGYLPDSWYEPLMPDSADSYREDFKEPVHSIVIEPGVTGIGSHAFYHYRNVTAVSIPDTVTSIGAWAFAVCDRLTEVQIPDSVTEIGDYAFTSCTKLSSITIPDSVTKINSYAFYGCTELSSVTIPASTEIGSGILKDTPWLQAQQEKDPLVILNHTVQDGKLCEGEVVIPEGTHTISAGAFSGCVGITAVTIPESVTEIPDYAFSGCSSLQSVTILNPYCTIAEPPAESSGYPLIPIGDTICNSVEPDDTYFDGWDHYKVTYTGVIRCYDGSPAQAFAEKYGYQFESLGAAPAHDNTVGDYTYQVSSDSQSVEITKYTGSAWELTIPAELDGKPVTAIGNDAFSGNGILNSVTIPDSVERIGNCAFNRCSRLTYVSIPEGLTSIGESAFASTSLCYVKLPESVTSIGPSAFVWCRELTTMIIPNPECTVFDSAETINNGFEGVDGEAVYFYNGTIYGAEDSTAHAYAEKYGYAFKHLSDAPAEEPYQPKDAYSYEINADGKTVTIVQTYNFEAEIRIPSEIDGMPVTCIGEGAFEGCTNLRSVVLPDSVTRLGDFAFGNCTNLTSVTLPDGLKEIGSHGFYHCSSLTEAALPDSVEQIGDWAFAECTALTSVSIPKNVTSIEEATYAGCDQLTAVTIPEGVKTIGMAAFSRCNNLAEVNLPASVTNIENGNFETEGLVIYGSKGSYAEQYAVNHGILFNKAPGSEPAGDFCDLNDDGTVNASDAALVLIASAAVGAGDASKAIPCEWADTNSDETVNASDAAYILIYSAAVGTGYEGTITDYILQH